jgi:hypothetical protein
MKKLIVSALVLAMTLTAGAAFAAGKTKMMKKKTGAPTVECSVGGQKSMVGTIDECMKMGGMVMNFPGPAPEKAMKPKKAKAPKAKMEKMEKKEMKNPEPKKAM